MIEDSPEINVDDLNLDDVVGMEPDDLTDTHRDFLETNKSHLTDDQSTKFGFGEDSGGEDKDDKGDDEEEDNDEDKGDDFDPDVEIKTKKKINEDDLNDEDDDDEDKKLKGIISRQQDMNDSQAVGGIIADSPELKPFKSLALRYMKSHPTLTANDAMAIASSGHQQKIGAQKEREAAAKVKKTQSGGSSHRPASTGAKNWDSASNDEVEAQIARAKGQRI